MTEDKFEILLGTFDVEVERAESRKAIEAARNAILAAFRELQAENALLRQAVEAVEWVYDDCGTHCPWCNAYVHSHSRLPKHKPDCLRQRALAEKVDDTTYTTRTTIRLEKKP